MTEIVVENQLINIFYDFLIIEHFCFAVTLWLWSFDLCYGYLV